MNLTTLKALAIRKASRSALIVKKYSPELLLGLGIIGVIGGTIVACKATTKAEKLLDDAAAMFKDIHDAAEKFTKEEYPVTERQTDVAIAYVQTGVSFVKLYAPAVTLSLLGVACILASYGIMKRRNVAIATAYKVLEKGFSQYRKRVVAEYGEDKDFEFRHGVTRKTVSVTVVDGVTGEKKKVKKEQLFVPERDASVYARFFDDLNPFWDKDSADMNFMFLSAQRDWAEHMLHKNGHLFLNDVYKQVGIKPTPDGQLMGWVDNANCDKVINMGIFEMHSEAARRFVNREEICFLMDFNVDQEPIYDLI